MKQTLILEFDLDNIDLREGDFAKEMTNAIDLILEDETIKDPVKFIAELLAKQEMSLELVLKMATKTFMQMLKELGPARAIIKKMEENNGK